MGLNVKLSPETPIQISFGIACATVAVVLGGFYWIADQVKDDVAATRADVAELRDNARDDDKTREDGDVALRQSLTDLTAQLQLTTAKLTQVTDSLTNLDNSIRTIDDKLSASITRQQEFEKSIVARLDSNAFGNSQIPAKWSEVQFQITSDIKAGGDPLAAWYQSLPEQRN